MECGGGGDKIKIQPLTLKHTLPTTRIGEVVVVVVKKGDLVREFSHTGGSWIDWVNQKQDIFGNLEVFGFVKNLEEFQYFQ